jgi:hypothetical protein
MADNITLQAPEVVVKPNVRHKLEEVYTSLKSAQDQNLLELDGEKLLKAIENGAIVPSGAGVALQGASLNMSDELLGTLHSIFGGDVTTVQKGLEPLKNKGFGVENLSKQDIGIGLERLSAERFKKEHPYAGMGLELAGGIVPAYFSKGASTPLTFTKAVGQGIGYGAASGYGATEETQPKEQGLASAFGGLSGGAFGGTLQAAGNVGFKAGKSIINAMFGSPEKQGIEAGKQLVRQAIESDVGSLDNALTMIASKKSGKQYTPADLGTNAQTALDAAYSLPAANKQVAKKFLENRNKGIPSRLTSDIQDAFGSTASFFDDFNALKMGRSENGKAMYGIAFERQIPIDKTFTTLLQRPSIQEAYQKGLQIAAERGIKNPKIALDATGKLVTSKGQVVNAADTEFLHYVKMGLDDLVYTGKSPSSGIGATQLKYIKDTRRELLDYIDSKNPSYKRARDYWADDTAALDAMKNGRSFLKADPDQLKYDISVMSNSEKEAFRLGAMSELIDKVGGSATSTIKDGVTTVVGNPARNLLKDPKRARLIRATFPDGAAGEAKYKKFVNNFLDEMDMQSTFSKVLGGSQTQPRQEAAKAFRGTVEEVTPSTSLTDIVINLIKQDKKSTVAAHEKAAATEAIKILTESNPARLRTIFQEMQTRKPMDVINDILQKAGRSTISPRATSGLAGQMGAGFESQYFADQKPNGLLTF